jgi:hypothetical protein
MLILAALTAGDVARRSIVFMLAGIAKKRNKSDECPVTDIETSPSGRP